MRPAEPLRLLDEILRLKKSWQTPEERYGLRNIDIDIIFIIRESSLSLIGIPSRLQDRRFVLMPLNC
jgi:7,8-dihydro-6-hydroxymethylpterin-pyrophosphokinase